ncbi:LOW QUALITY PROTEIN: hypothetical protein T265_14584 [Opisthorchis viverrini]|uniref:Uncharacterized protein n=1 Tax=Opisthorchis viverrini TaxID=6198 RepID=A0A075A8A2_OPIVI|nr:LOW QUALITY PROTEIN: hypothetical protein T265_14584 [Opisthorchis viverrini]KER23674.1 LOW QUALITY PROTEIN: hypothetical protein T265_14584 [Opisthorchis viverrini]
MIEKKLGILVLLRKARFRRIGRPHSDLHPCPVELNISAHGQQWYCVKYRLARWPKWLQRELTNRKVRGSNPPAASRLPLSRLGQPGSIPALYTNDHSKDKNLCEGQLLRPTRALKRRRITPFSIGPLQVRFCPVSEANVCLKAENHCTVASSILGIISTKLQEIPNHMLADEPIVVVDKFVYLGSCISPGGLAKDEISILIGKARAAFANLRHLWRRRDISFSVKGRVYNAAVTLAWPRTACVSRPTSSEDSFCTSTVEESQRRSKNDLEAKYRSHYQQTQLRWSLPSSWIGTMRRAISVVRDIVRHGPVASSVALVHPRYCFQCIAPFPTPTPT